MAIDPEEGNDMLQLLGLGRELLGVEDISSEAPAFCWITWSFKFFTA